MARLRFPGRPGHRFDRISVRFFADDIKNLHDPSLAFLPQFKRGLQAFRDLVGQSDEVLSFNDMTAFKMADIAYQIQAQFVDMSVFLDAIQCCRTVYLIFQTNL